MIYSMSLSSPARVMSRLHGGKILQVRESVERANGQEERLPEGVSSFILTG
jgi:hypothetical protein